MVFVLSLNVSARDPILEASLKNSDLSYGGAFEFMLKRAGLGNSVNFIHAINLIASLGVANAYLYVAV
jgi:amino acid permease